MEVGEAAPCLVRSVSQPFFATREFKEGDHLRALTTSVSFGRFMTEPLDWERWSSFSHNRTLEDVQKYSRPGAVAEKKAFFEAHYKKIAANKAAKSPKKENQAPKYSPEINAKTDANSKKLDPTRLTTHSAIDTNLVLSSHIDERMSSNEHLEREYSAETNAKTDANSMNLDPTRLNAHSAIDTNLVLSSHIDELMSSNGQVEQEIAASEDVRSPSTNLGLSQFGNFDGNASHTGHMEQEKASTESVSMENHQFQGVILDQSNVPSTGYMEQEKESTESVSMENHQDQSSHVEKNKKTDIKDAASDMDKISGQTKPEISSCKSSNKNGACKLQSPWKAPTPPIRLRKAARDVTEKKRSTPQSVHMSMNFPPARNKNGTSNTLSKPKDRLIQQALTRVPVDGVKKNSQVLPRSEKKRSKPLLDCSVNGSKTVVMNSFSANHSEASSACTKKPRFTTVTSSFSFRSEERAAKRKEFFQKLEEKGNAKEAKGIQLQPKLKEKARNDNKKLRWSTTLEGKPSTSETKAPSNSMQKEKARNDNKKLRWSTTLEAKPSTSETKAPSTSMQKEKARNHNKKVRWSTTLEAIPSTSETKAPNNSMQKEKARNDIKKLRWSSTLEAKPSTSETKEPSNSTLRKTPLRDPSRVVQSVTMFQIMQVPTTQPCSPYLGRKPTPRLVQDTSYQSPWRSSSKTKNFIEINKKKLSSSMASCQLRKCMIQP